MHFNPFCVSIILAFAQICFSAWGNTPSEKTYPFLKGQSTSIQDPFQLRDPFKKKKVFSVVKEKKNKNKGVFSNVPDIENIPIGSVRIVGILLGGDRRAVAKIDNNGSLSAESYILKEGMQLGENKAEIKAILPGGVVLVERFKNVYDQDEYLETILPVSPE